MTTLVPNSLLAIPPALVLLDAKIASNSAQIDFTQFINSTYDTYVVEFFDVQPATTSTQLFLRTSSNAGVSFDAGASDYNFSFARTLSATSGTFTNQSAGATAIQITNDHSNSASRGSSGRIEFSNPVGTAKQKQFIFDCVNPYNGGEDGRNVGIGTRLSTSAINALRFIMSSGNITSGTFRLYGVKK